MRDQPSNFGTPVAYSEHTVSEERRSLEKEDGFYNPSDRTDASTSDRKSLNTQDSMLMRQNTVDGKKEGPRGSEDVDNPPEIARGEREDGRIDVRWPFAIRAEGSVKRVLHHFKTQRRGRDQLHSGKKGYGIVKAAFDMAEEIAKEVNVEKNQKINILVHVDLDPKAGNNDVVIKMEVKDVELPTHLGHQFESVEEYEEWLDTLKDRTDLDNRREQAAFREARGETLSRADKGDVEEVNVMDTARRIKAEKKAERRQ